MTDDLAAAIAYLRAMIPLRNGDQDGRARQNRVSRIAIVCDACQQQAQEIAQLRESVEGHIRGNAKLCDVAAKNLGRAEQAGALAARYKTALLAIVNRLRLLSGRWPCPECGRPNEYRPLRTVVLRFEDGGEAIAGCWRCGNKLDALFDEAIALAEEL